MVTAKVGGKIVQIMKFASVVKLEDTDEATFGQQGHADIVEHQRA
jgi:hypothetical protein